MASTAAQATDETGPAMTGSTIGSTDLADRYSGIRFRRDPIVADGSSKVGTQAFRLVDNDIADQTSRHTAMESNLSRGHPNPRLSGLVQP